MLQQNSSKGKLFEIIRGKIMKKTPVVISPSNSTADIKKRWDKISGSKWLTAMGQLTPQEIRKKFATETGRYLIFLILFTVITLAPRNEKPSFQLTKSIRDYLLSAPRNTDIPQYTEIATIDDFWNWMINSFHPRTFRSDWYNGEEFENSEYGNVLYANTIVGAIRFRQLRVKSGSCGLKKDVHLRESCYPKFSTANQIKKPFTKENVTFVYTSEENGYNHWGELSFYPSGGYITDVPSNNSALALQSISNLKTVGWIDEATRAVIIEMVLYNANVELHTAAVMAIEISATGGVFATAQFRTQRLINYVHPADWVLFVVEMIFLLMLLFYIYEEVMEIKDEGWSYFSQGWNYVDWANIICFVIVIIMRIKQAVDANHLNMNPLPTEFVNYSSLTFSISQEQNINAFNGLLCWIKIFKYIHIFPKMKLLTTTLIKSARAVLYFLIMFFIIFLGFSFALYISVGRDASSFADIQTSMFTLFQATLGQFNFDELRQANRVLGPLFFIVYMLLVFFVLANMFIAIITLSYDEEVKAYRIEKESNVHHIVEDAILGFVKAKFGAVRNAIVSLYSGYKKEVVTSDTDGDGRLDKEELARLREKVGDNQELIALIDDADKNKDQQLSTAETRELLKKIDAKMKESVSKVTRAEKEDETFIQTSLQSSREKEDPINTLNRPNLRLIASGGGPITLDSSTIIEKSSSINSQPHTRIELSTLIVDGKNENHLPPAERITSRQQDVKLRNIELQISVLENSVKEDVKRLEDKMDKIIRMIQQIALVNNPDDYSTRESKKR